jgi:hypothetical protein
MHYRKQYISSNYLKIYRDKIFGSSLIKESNMIYSQDETFNTYRMIPDDHVHFYKYELKASRVNYITQATPQALLDIFALLGGFAAFLTRILSWVLGFYQRFQLKKNAIKHLYYYSRSKRTQKRSSSVVSDHLETLENKQTLMEDDTR